jgi:hypothetical protein
MDFGLWECCEEERVRAVGKWQEFVGPVLVSDKTLQLLR